MIDSHGLSDQVSALEALLPQPSGPEMRVRTLVELSWYLRQRDTRRAVELVEAAEPLLQFLDDAEAECASARLKLVRGEAFRLFADLDRARALIAEAVDGYRTAGDRIGEGDAQYCEAERLYFAGDIDGAVGRLHIARGLFLEAGDTVRARIAEIRSLDLRLAPDTAAVREIWNGMRGLEVQSHPAVLALSAFVEASLLRDRSDFLAAVETAKTGVPHAEQAGMVWLTIALLNLIGGVFGNISDYTSAMEWKQKAYAIAQPTGWPESRGGTLASLAHTRGRIGQKKEARLLYLDALAELQMLSGTRRFQITCVTYGNTCLELGATEEALEWFSRALENATLGQQQDVQLLALLGTARAYNALDRLEEAQERLGRALGIARLRDNRLEQVVALHALAGTRRRRSCYSTEGRREAIALLEEAVEVGRTIPGYVVRSDLLSELASDYEAVGDYRLALECERLARASWERSFNKESADRLAAMQARFETQRARDEAEHMKILAQAETERAQALDQANQALEQLGLAGKQITASLDIDAVLITLRERLGVLLQAPCMFIGLLDETRQRIDIQFRVEDGRSLPSYSIALSNPDSYSARAVRENRELLVDASSGAGDPAHVPGTRAMLSMFYCPLTVRGRVLGVLSVQQDRPKAFGPREQRIVRSVAAYGAIALANAQAYRSLDEALATLQDAQGRLVQQEKLASLGQLVAGVAHEVNTPIGILLGLASHLAEEVEGIGARLAQGQLRKSDLVQHLKTTEETATLMLATAKRAANLVSAFKQVAADRTNDEARELELTDYLREVAATVQPLLRPRGISLGVEGDPGVRLTTYPGLLAQVVTNLVENAVSHAFDGIAAPSITLTVRPAPDTGEQDEEMIEVEVADNGVGMTAAVRSKAFEPFFTTRRSSGGTGLGLHVVHNVVTGPLQGAVDLASEPGRGCRFTLRLPTGLRAGRFGDLTTDPALAMVLGG